MKDTIRRIYYLFGLFILFAFLHNVVSAILDVEGGFFFVLALISGFSFIGFLLYTVLVALRKGTLAELWSLGWLGLLGLIGFLPQFGPMFFGLYGFFGFFGLKRSDSSDYH